MNVFLRNEQNTKKDTIETVRLHMDEEWHIQ